MHARFLGKQIPLRVVPRRLTLPRRRRRRRRRRNGLLLFLFRPRPIDDGDAGLPFRAPSSFRALDFSPKQLRGRHSFRKVVLVFAQEPIKVSLVLIFSHVNFPLRARMRGWRANMPEDRVERVGDGFYPMRPNGARSRSTDRRGKYVENEERRLDRRR